MLDLVGPTERAHAHSRKAKLFTGASAGAFLVGLGILLWLVFAGIDSAFWMFFGGGLMVMGIVIFIATLIWRANVVTTFGAGMYEDQPHLRRRRQ